MNISAYRLGVQGVQMQKIKNIIMFLKMCFSQIVTNSQISHIFTSQNTILGEAALTPGHNISAIMF